MRLPVLLRKTVCSVVSASIMVLPCWAWGGETNMSAYAKQGAEVGSIARQGYLSSPPTANQAGISITVDGKPVNVTTGELSNAESALNKKYTEADLEKLKKMMKGGDDTYANESAKTSREELYGDNSTAEGMAYGLLLEADAKPDMPWNETGVDEKADRVFENVAEFTENFADCTADKAVVPVTKEKTITERVVCEQVLDRTSNCKISHDYRAGVIRYLAKQTNNPYTCLKNAADRMNFQSCGDGCTMVWLGKVGDNYIDGGSCRLCEEEIYFQVLNPDAITKAELEYAAYDDQMQVWVGPPGRETKFYEGPNWGRFPYNDRDAGRTGYGCELGTHWIWDPYRTGPGCTESSCRYTQTNMGPINITSAVKSAGEGGTIRFMLRDAIGGKGEAYARIKVYYDASKAIVDDAWRPAECVQSGIGIDDKFASGNYYCSDMPPAAQGMPGCALIDGVYVCERHLNPSPLKNISNLCMEVTVDAKFDFYKGQMDCWVDANGRTQCPVNEGGKLDNCEEAKAGRTCTRVGSQCSEGARGASNTCYVNDVFLDCETVVEVQEAELQTTYNCPGEMSCMGEECVEISKIENANFAKVSALLNAAQYLTQDMTCAGLDEDGHPTGNEDISCKVFGGEPGYCKKAVGGIQDCCKNQNPIGVSPYLGILKAVAAGKSAAGNANLDVTSLDFWQAGIIDEGKAVGMWGSQMVNGSWTQPTLHHSFENGEQITWEGLPEGVEATGKLGWTAAGYLNDFATLIENIDSVKGIIKASVEIYLKRLASQIAGYIKDQVMKLIGDAVKKLFGDAAASSSIMGSAQTEAVKQVMGYASTALGAIAAIYAAYCVAVMIIQKIYACTDEELELVSKRDTKNCTYIGSYCKKKILGACIEKRYSYCCFNSPLSRIINEQVRKQGLAKYNGFGSVKHPNCGGIDVSDLEKIDWDRIDLGEWTAILSQNGQLPTGAKADLETLTGAGSKYDWNGNRVSSDKRTDARIKYIDVDKSREQADLYTAGETGMVPGSGQGVPNSDIQDLIDKYSPDLTVQ